jgi:hypothetical protein
MLLEDAQPMRSMLHRSTKMPADMPCGAGLMSAAETVHIQRLMSHRPVPNIVTNNNAQKQNMGNCRQR